MPDSGQETDIEMWRTCALCAGHYLERMGSKGFAGRSSTSRIPDEDEDDLSSNDEDDLDDDYWDLDELGIDPEEFYELMPQLVFSQALTANQLNFNPINSAGWQYEFLPYPALCKVLVRSTDAAERMTVYSGSETIQEKSPVAAGGTAGQTPTDFNVPAVVWKGAARDRIKLVIDNTGAGSPTVDGVIIIEPLF